MVLAIHSCVVSFGKEVVGYFIAKINTYLGQTCVFLMEEKWLVLTKRDNPSLVNRFFFTDVDVDVEVGPGLLSLHLRAWRGNWTTNKF